MTLLNSKGEVADFLDVSQFIPGRSAYECVAYSASLIKFCGEPGHGPTGTALEASNLAQYWYGKEEGSNLSSNTNGMSLDAMYNMLGGMNLKYSPLVSTLSQAKIALEGGLPVLLCGAETGMYDMDLGDHIPYTWTPTGNHCIVVSGISSDGNVLVHDCANISPSGVRPGPRRYDASKLQIVSVTAIHMPWTEEVVIDLSTPGISSFFEAIPNNWWQCKQTGKIVRGEILATYQKVGNSGLNGLTWWGLPKSNEVNVETFDGFQHLAGQGITVQFFERAVVAFDPEHKISFPPGAERVYTLQLYEVPGQDPAVTQLQQQIAQLQANLTQAQKGLNPASVADRLTALGLQIKQGQDALTHAQNLVVQPIS